MFRIIIKTQWMNERFKVKDFCCYIFLLSHAISIECKMVFFFSLYFILSFVMFRLLNVQNEMIPKHTKYTKETLKSCYTFSHFKIRSALSKANTEEKKKQR